MSTSAPVGGVVTSGVRKDRDQSSFPDKEQYRRLQARQDHDFATGKRNTRPAFTHMNPDDSKADMGNSNKTLEQSKDDGETEV